MTAVLHPVATADAAPLWRFDRFGTLHAWMRDTLELHADCAVALALTAVERELGDRQWKAATPICAACKATVTERWRDRPKEATQ